MDFEDLLNRYRKSISSNGSDKEISPRVVVEAGPVPARIAPGGRPTVTTDQLLDVLRQQRTPVSETTATTEMTEMKDLLRSMGILEEQVPPTPSDTTHPADASDFSTSIFHNDPVLNALDRIGQENPASENLASFDFSKPPLVSYHTSTAPISSDTTDLINDLFASVTNFDAPPPPEIPPQVPVDHPTCFSEPVDQDEQRIQELRNQIRSEESQKYMTRAEIERKVVECTTICTETQALVKSLEKRVQQIDLHFRFIRQIIAVDDSEIQTYIRSLHEDTTTTPMVLDSIIPPPPITAPPVVVDNPVVIEPEPAPITVPPVVVDDPVVIEPEPAPITAPPVVVDVPMVIEPEPAPITVPPVVVDDPIDVVAINPPPLIPVQEHRPEKVEVPKNTVTNTSFVPLRTVPKVTRPATNIFGQRHSRFSSFT